MRNLLLIIMVMMSASLLAQRTTLRQQSFPTSLPSVDENIEWQRDIYREVNLTENENAGLFCPQEPTINQKGLFTTLLSLATEKKIPLYRYNIDGNEVFNAAAKIDVRDVLKNHHIFYEEVNDSIFVDPSDIPATAVMLYYIREGIYYDMTNSSFRIKVQALSPVLIEEDDMTGVPTRYPLFWVLYSDIEPFLKDLTIIPDYGNMSMVMSMTDYFTLNKYKGDIYKVSNARGLTLRQMVDSDSALIVTQQRIERQLRKVRKTTYNTYYKEDSQKRQPPVEKKRKKLFTFKKEREETVVTAEND